MHRIWARAVHRNCSGTPNTPRLGRWRCNHRLCLGSRHRRTRSPPSCHRRNSALRPLLPSRYQLSPRFPSLRPRSIHSQVLRQSDGSHRSDICRLPLPDTRPAIRTALRTRSPPKSAIHGSSYLHPCIQLRTCPEPGFHRPLAQRIPPACAASFLASSPLLYRSTFRRPPP